MNMIKKRLGRLGKCQIDYVYQGCIPNLQVEHNKQTTQNLAFII